MVWKSRAKLPFKFKTGEPTTVYFATPSHAPGWTELEALPIHKRTAGLGKMLFKGPGGTYYGLELKGMGHVDTRQIEPVLSIKPLKEAAVAGTLGILDRKDAKLEIDNARAFMKARIRTLLPVALVKIGQIVDEEGERISIGEARGRGMLHPETKEPVVLVRGYTTRYRIANMWGVGRGEMRAMIDEAKAVLKREFGRELTDREYAMWFAENVAKQIARMHSKGFIHGYLSAHNIALDARIVDLDSVERFKPSQITRPETAFAVRDDYDDAKRALALFRQSLLKSLGIGISRTKMNKMFAESYRNALRPDMQWIVQHE